MILKNDTKKVLFLGKIENPILGRSYRNFARIWLISILYRGLFSYSILADLFCSNLTMKYLSDWVIIWHTYHRIARLVRIKKLNIKLHKRET